MKDINQVNFIFPSVDQIKNSALFKPIDTTYAMTYQSYLNGIENGLYNAWDVSVRTGYLLGQTTNEIVRNVLGGVSQIDKLKKDGTIKSLRNSIYSNTRTVLQSLANETRTMIFEENEKYFSDDENRYEYMATLDNRTCLVCGSLDGSLFKNIRDVKYQLPKHRGCRCIVLPYFEIEGDKKSSKNGYVDSKVTFNDWLKEQDKETQLDVLGRTRFELFKNGEDIGQFVDNGKILTLPQITAKLSTTETNNTVNDKIANLIRELENQKVEPIEFKKFEKQLSEQEIISRLDTRSNKEGSCASLSFAYIANKSGYDVLDSRGGKSEMIFRQYDSVYTIATLKGVKSEIIWSSNHFDAVKKLLEKMEVEKEYNLLAGQHSAIVKKTESGIFEYLELQSNLTSGFMLLNDYYIKERFGCKKPIIINGKLTELPAMLIDIKTLGQSKDFLDIMKYINTKRS